MPFEKLVEDKEILDQFDRADIPRNAYTYAEIAEGIDAIEPEAVRQRLVKMDGEKVESVEVGGVKLYHRPGAKVFADGGLGQATWTLPADIEDSLMRFGLDAAILGAASLGLLAAVMLFVGMGIEYLGSVYGVSPTARVLAVLAVAVVLGVGIHLRPTWVPFLGRVNPMDGGRQ